MRRSDPYDSQSSNYQRQTRVYRQSNSEQRTLPLPEAKQRDKYGDVNEKNTSSNDPSQNSRLWQRNASGSADFIYESPEKASLLSTLFGSSLERLSGSRNISKGLFLLPLLLGGIGFWISQKTSTDSVTEIEYPAFVFEHPYVSSSYYSSTKSLKTLQSLERQQVQPKKDQLAGKHTSGEKDFTRITKTRLAIVRPFCAFDAGPLPTTFACWEGFPPCRAAAADLGEGFDEEYWAEHADPYFDKVGSHMQRDAAVDVFLFYSQSFSENDEAIESVDTILDQFFLPGGWSQCFNSIYAIEANIPPELDLYLPAAQETLYNWVNGPNRQYEAAVRIIQSGEWGDYDGFYFMEGDSIPIKNYWLDVVLSEIEVNRPFAILGAKYNGDKWDNFYEQIPMSLLDHTNGNAIYNTSHPLLERLVGQLEVEAACPYNSIPYDYRQSQMWIEGTMGIVPKLSPQIMLNEEGKNITLSNNTAMFKKWGDLWAHTHPFKETPVIHNYAATNLIPRHLGPEYIIHGAKLYAPWDPSKIDITLVVSEWFFDRSAKLLETLDSRDHPFSETIIMLPPNVEAREDYANMTIVPTRSQHRQAPDVMDMCEADVKTEWFMLTNSYHIVANHVDLMFTPGKFQPVVPFTPATYPFCFKFPYCKETVTLAQKFNPGHKKVVLDFDMLYHTETRDAFCQEWRKMNGEEGEDLYKNRVFKRKKIIGPSGPTGTSYTAYLFREKKEGMYKLIDRSLYGARAPFIKMFAREEKLDGMTEEELAQKMGMGGDNITDCNCFAFETVGECEGSSLGCSWRPLFESCHPPEMIDDGTPICPQTEAPTFSPTEAFDANDKIDTDAPTVTPTAAPVKVNPWYARVFKASEHEAATSISDADDEF